MKNKFTLAALLISLSTPVFAQDCGDLCGNKIWREALPADILTAVQAAEVNATDQYGATALHMAVAFASTDKVAILIDAGWDVTIADTWGTQPIHAVMGGNPANTIATMNLLLENGADINALEGDNKTPIFFATRSSVDILAAIIAAGADVTLQDEDGRSLLHTALWGQVDAETILFLIKAGVDVALTEKHGKTAYEIATEMERFADNAELLAALKP